MIYYEYSPSQLETKAIELTQGFDKERLLHPKPIDVYDVVDYIGCTPDWIYLTPNQSYLGMTAYNDGYWWAWRRMRSLLVKTNFAGLRRYAEH